MKTTHNKRKIQKLAVLTGITIVLACLSLSCGSRKENKLSLYINEYQKSYYKEGIEEFRETYPDVELELVTLGMTEPLSSVQKVKTEMMAGEGPDLLLFSSLGIDDVNKYMAAGAYAPLDEYMAADKEGDSDAYVSKVMEGGQFNGKQYVMPLNYSVQVILSSQEALEEAGFDIAACTDMLSIMQQISALYETDYKYQILADCSMFIFFPQQLKGEFMDYATGKIGTDRKELRAACDAYQNIFYEDSHADSLMDQGYYSHGTSILDRKAYIAAMSGGLTVSLQQVAAISAKETPVLIPITKGDGKPIAQIREYAGIRANSENKENAWNMLRILMSENMQTQMAGAYNAAPVFKSAIDAQIQESIEEAVSDGAKEGVETGPIDEQLKEKYLDYLKNPGTAMFPNDLSRKFIERMLPYLEGEGEYEDCLKEFENYAGIYLTE